jgi:hypothetical protein
MKTLEISHQIGNYIHFYINSLYWLHFDFVGGSFVLDSYLDIVETLLSNSLGVFMCTNVFFGPPFGPKVRISSFPQFLNIPHFLDVLFVNEFTSLKFHVFQ